MSGRLILLPKKSYTPWNPENVERVLRDERLERERLQNKQQISDRDASKRRIYTLKQQKSQSQNNTNTNTNTNVSCTEQNETKHFNLFEKEEQQMLEKISIPNKQFRDDSSCKRKNETRVYLNHYSMNSRTNNKNQLSEQSETKIKLRMDPMNLFFSKEIPPSYGNTHKSSSRIDNKKIIYSKMRNRDDNMNRDSKTQAPTFEQTNQSQLEAKGQYKHSNKNGSVSSDSSYEIKKNRIDRRRQHKKHKRKRHEHHRHHKSRKKKKRKPSSQSILSDDESYVSCSSSSSISYSKYKRRERHTRRQRKHHKRTKNRGKDDGNTLGDTKLISRNKDIELKK